MSDSDGSSHEDVGDVHDIEDDDVAPAKKAESNERGVAAAGKPVLGYFWDLASLEDSKRHKAALELMDKLEELQGAEEDTSVMGGTLEYAVKRLVRGLTSSRDAARQGYAAVLTEVLVTFGELVSAEHCNDEFEKAHEVADEKDGNLGRVFYRLALLNSGKFDAAAPENADSLREHVTFLMDLSERKEYAAELCAEAVTEYIKKIPSSTFEEVLLPDLLGPRLQKPVEEYTPEMVSIAIVASQRFPKLDWASLYPWPDAVVVTRRNLPALFNIMKLTAGRQPRIHSVWDHLVDMVAPELDEEPDANADEKARRKWEKRRDKRTAQLDALLEPLGHWMNELLYNGTHARKFIGFQLFERLLPRVGVERAAVLFSRPFLRCVINNVHSKEAYLHEAARHLLKTLTVEAGKDMNLRVAILSHIIGMNGSHQFDQLTRTKTVATLMSGLDSAGVAAYMKQMKDLFYSESDVSRAPDGDVEGEVPAPVAEPASVESRRIWVVDQIYNLARYNKIPKEESQLEALANFLLLHGFFSLEQGAKLAPLNLGELAVVPPFELSEKLREKCANNFYNLLGSLGDDTPDDEPAAAPEPTKKGRKGKEKAPEPVRPASGKQSRGLMASGELWVHSLLQRAEKLRTTKRVSLADDLEEEGAAALARVLEQVEKLRAKSAKSKDPKLPQQNLAWQLLFLHLGFQLYKNSEEVTGLLEDLHQCYDNATAPKTKKTPKKGKAAAPAAEEEDGEPAPFEVMIDILLGLLAKPSTMLRDVVQTVFRAFCHEMTPKALSQLVEVVTTAGRGDDMLDVEEEEAAPEELESVFRKGAAGVGAEDEAEEEASEEEDKPVKGKKQQGGKSQPNGKPAGKDKKHKGKAAEEVEEVEEEANDDDNDDAEDDEDDEDVEIEDEDEEIGDEELAERRRKVREALGDAAEGSDEEEEEEDLMDDDAMFEKDHLLAAVFSNLAKAKKQKGGKEAKKAMQHFKFRVMELLELFLRKQPTNPLILTLHYPLLKSIHRTNPTREDATLVERISGFLKNKLSRAREYPPAEAINVAEVHGAIEQIFSIVHNTHTPNSVLELSSHSILFLMRVLIGGQETSGKDDNYGNLDVDKVCNLYKTTFEGYKAHRFRNLSAQFFKALIDRYPRVAAKMATDFAEGAGAASNVYLRTEIAGLLCQVLSRKHAVDVEAVKLLVPYVQHAVTTGVEVVDIKAKKLKDVLRAAHMVAQLVGPNGPWDVEAMAKSLAVVQAEKYAGLRQQCIQLLAAVSGRPTEECKKTLASMKPEPAPASKGPKPGKPTGAPAPPKVKPRAGAKVPLLPKAERKALKKERQKKRKAEQMSRKSGSGSEPPAKRPKTDHSNASTSVGGANGAEAKPKGKDKEKAKEKHKGKPAETAAAAPAAAAPMGNGVGAKRKRREEDDGPAKKKERL